jgi:hypothetical protein
MSVICQAKAVKKIPFISYLFIKVNHPSGVEGICKNNIIKVVLIFAAFAMCF